MKGRIKKASQRKGELMIYAVIRVTVLGQSLPDDAFSGLDCSIRLFHPDERSFNAFPLANLIYFLFFFFFFFFFQAKDGGRKMRMMLSDWHV